MKKIEIMGNQTESKKKNKSGRSSKFIKSDAIS